ncbi:MAG TPA: hypothetical protein DD405_07190, partial [Desulfobacteraceae bacterium]|nr:hypothetical protein [Desulfobacteraceae bacterium]
MEIKEYLSNKGIVVKKVRGEELLINCPFCGDQQMKGAVNSIHGAFNCFRLNNCGMQLSWWDFQKKLGDNPQQLSGWKPTTTFLPKPAKKYIKPKGKVKRVETKIMKYLNGRGFTAETIKFFRIGEKDNAIAFPYFKNKELVGVKYRTL